MNNSLLTHILININIQRVVWYIDQYYYMAFPAQQQYNKYIQINTKMSLFGTINFYQWQYNNNDE